MSMKKVTSDQPHWIGRDTKNENGRLVCSCAAVLTSMHTEQCQMHVGGNGAKSFEDAHVEHG